MNFYLRSFLSQSFLRMLEVFCVCVINRPFFSSPDQNHRTLVKVQGLSLV